MNNEITVKKVELRDPNLMISTWQSLARVPKKWFSKIECVIVDEAHLASGKTLQSIVKRCVNADFKIGLTGTLKNTKIHKLQLISIFGDVYKSITAFELIEKGMASKLKIKILVLKHSLASSERLYHDYSYNDEIKTLLNDKNRTKLIAKVALNTPKNTVIMFGRIKHGKEIFKVLNDLNVDNKKIFYLDGSVKLKSRELIRQYTEENDGVIIVAMQKIFSTGINIKNLHNLITAMPSKSSVTYLQMIGRTLRKLDGKVATLYDISDLYSTPRNNQNISFKHALERMKIYKDAKFTYTVKEIQF